MFKIGIFLNESIEESQRKYGKKYFLHLCFKKEESHKIDFEHKGETRQFTQHNGPLIARKLGDSSPRLFNSFSGNFFNRLAGNTIREGLIHFDESTYMAFESFEEIKLKAQFYLKYPNENDIDYDYKADLKIIDECLKFEFRKTLEIRCDNDEN